MFGLELVAKRKDEALQVLLALADQEHPAAGRDSLGGKNTHTHTKGCVSDC